VTHRVILTNPCSRERFKRIVDQAPAGYVAEVREPTRTNAQNDKMWAQLTDVSVSCPGGRKLEPRKWKSLFMDALEKELNDASFGSQWEPGLNDEGVVNLGHRSSRLTKSQMGELLSFIEAWGTENGVRWTDEARAA
jgi:hypothetical protein